jgi:hypothetical protein
MDESAQERWEGATDDPSFHAAVGALAEASHEAPIVDSYGYNATPGSHPGFVVRDLLLSLDLEAVDRSGLLTLEITDGRQQYSVELDLDRGEAALFSEASDSSIDEAVLPAEALQQPMRLELSLMDRQFQFALNGAALFDPVGEAESDPDRPAPRRPLRMAAEGGQFRVSNIRVSRDVYYTPKSEDRGPHRLASDEFFVLGDNSPVSLDSRCWEDPAVHRDHLIGKPLVVHLPSRQGQLTLFGETRYVRIPDFSRVRYIR